MSQWPDRNKIAEDEEVARKKKALLANRAAKAKEEELKRHRRKHNQEVIDTGSEKDTDMVNTKSLSFLSSDAISWMNKRRPIIVNGLAQQSHLTPAKALHYREIFKGLDFDGSGGISLEEMDEAIQYVNKNEPGCVERPREIMDFFRGMDIDGNGVIDFNEFLMAMSIENSSSGHEGMQKAFQSFASMHRRRNVLDIFLNKKVRDTDKYKEFLTLFDKQNVEEVGASTVQGQIKMFKDQVGRAFLYYVGQDTNLLSMLISSLSY